MNMLELPFPFQPNMQKIQNFPQVAFDKVLSEQPKFKETIDKQFQQTKFGEEHLFKEQVTMRHGVVPGSSFKAITGKITINGDIIKALFFDLEPREIRPEMPKDQRSGRLCKYTYFPTKEIEAYANNATEFKQIAYIFHQVQDISVPLISNREFVTLRFTEDQSQGGKKKICVYTHYCEPGVQFCSKVVRANLLNFNCYEEIGNGQFTATNYFHCDPQGSVPAALFNMQLEAQMDFLVELKKFVEAQSK